MEDNGYRVQDRTFLQSRFSVPVHIEQYIGNGQTDRCRFRHGDFGQFIVGFFSRDGGDGAVRKTVDYAGAEGTRDITE